MCCLIQEFNVKILVSRIMAALNFVKKVSIHRLGKQSILCREFSDFIYVNKQHN